MAFKPLTALLTLVFNLSNISFLKKIENKGTLVLLEKLLTHCNPSPLQVKCDQYWPTRGTETYGLIQVTLLDTVELATYCVRTFSLFKVRSLLGVASLLPPQPPHAEPLHPSTPPPLSSKSASPERLQREEGGETVPVHGLARPRGSRAPHPLPGLPQAGEIVQSSRRGAHGGTLQVRNDVVAGKTSSSMKLILPSPFAVMNT